jgi:predicted DNA-binding antitoxin AbrB/MazE fold protein
MTQANKTTGRTLEVNDYIAFDSAAQDIDTPDTTLWMKIVEVVFEDGFRGYKVAFPDGEVMRSAILAKHVSRFKTASQYAEDEMDINALEKIWYEMTTATIEHEYFCDCAACRERVATGKVIERYYDVRFRELQAKLARNSFETARLLAA